MTESFVPPIKRSSSLAAERVLQRDHVSRYPTRGFRRRLIEMGDERVKSEILSLLAVPGIPQPRLLDLGAGDGSFSMRVAHCLGLDRIDLVDAADFTEAWKSKSLEAGINAQGNVMNIDGPLPYPDGSYHVVLSNQVVEHLYDPFTHLKEIHRILDDDGYAIVSTPNLSGIQYRLMLLLGLLPTTLSVGLYVHNDTLNIEEPSVTSYARHISCLTAREWSKIARTLGFEIDKMHTLVIYLVPQLVEKMVTAVLPWGNYVVFRMRKA